jgi:PAS domain S-box-containing protein
MSEPGQGQDEQSNEAGGTRRLEQEVDRLWSRDVAEQLKLSEAKYRALVEGSSDFIYVLDPDGRFTFANRELENLLGYLPDEVIGKHFTEVLHPDDATDLGRAFHERRTGERATKRLEVRLRSKRGDRLDVELDIRHFAVSASGIYHDETYVGTHGVARDITERKYQETKNRALQIVREAVWAMVRADDIQQVLNSIQSSLQTMEMPCARFAVAVVDMDDPPVLSVYSAEEDQGVKRRAEIMVTDTEPFAMAMVSAWRRGRMRYHRDLGKPPVPCDLDALRTYVGPLSALVQAPFSHGVLLLPGGREGAFSPRHLEFLTQLAQVLSEAFHRLGDLQELTLSEKRYRTLVETPNLVVMLLDNQLNFIYVSPQVDSWLGYLPSEFYADPGMLDEIVHADDMDALRMLLDSAPEAELREIEFRWRARDGRELWATGSLFPIYETPEDEAISRVSMIQLVVQDSTQRKRGEDQIRQSLAEKEVLLKEIHHRVKNNLQVVSSLLHLQSARMDDREARAVFEDSQHRINSMALIHEELYNSGNLARIDFGVYVQHLIEGLVDSYAIIAGRIAVDVCVDTLQQDLDSAIPLGLIINELVANSLKYAFPDGRQGRISIEYHAFGEDAWVLTVADDGVGLPPGIALETLHSLGIKLVQTLVAQLHADLELHTDSNGTRFAIASR